MTRATFFKHFELLADQPDAVAKMRELVLELAVQGTLSSRLAGDGSVPPVVELRENAATLAASLGLRSPKEPLEEAEPPFDVPSHWRWMALADIGAARTGTTPGKTDQDAFNGDIPFIKPADILPNSIDYSNESLTRQGAESGSRLAPRGSLLMVCIGTIGKCNLIERECAFNQQINSLTPVASVDPRYLLVAARSRSFQAAAWKKSSSTTIAILNKGKWLSIPVPLPPLAEQRRIVAKVDELMALCDELEQRQQARQHARSHVTQSAYHHLTAAKDPADFRYRFNFILQHSAFILDDVPQLRQAILQLAVQGRLLPRDEARGRVVQPSESQKQKLSAKNDEPPFDVPGHWRWQQVGQVSELINGDRSKSYPNKAEYVREGVAWINTGHIEPDGTLSLETMHYITRAKFDSLRSGKVKPGDLVYCLRGATLGKTAIISQFSEGAVASSLVIIRLADSVAPKYAYYFLTSPLGRQQIWKFDNGSAQPNLSAESVKKYWIPIPPLAEQKRIVARVEELLRWCDTLEAQLHQTRTLGAHLLASTLHHLLAA